MTTRAQQDPVYRDDWASVAADRDGTECTLRANAKLFSWVLRNARSIQDS